MSELIGLMIKLPLFFNYDVNRRLGSIEITDKDFFDLYVKDVFEKDISENISLEFGICVDLESKEIILASLNPKGVLE